MNVTILTIPSFPATVTQKSPLRHLPPTPYKPPQVEFSGLPQTSQQLQASLSWSKFKSWKLINEKLFCQFFDFWDLTASNIGNFESVLKRFPLNFHHSSISDTVLERRRYRVYRKNSHSSPQNLQKIFQKRFSYHILVF